jgi:haloacetate dehalogenase
MFEGFERRRVATAGCDIHLALGGSGPPLLLLHGFPQSHVCWHRVAPRLAPHFTLVVPDLRGYGDSGKPASDPEHYAYSKRAMAQDQVQAMSALGFDRLGVAGHDRGGRVAHRMALDHADRVRKVAVLDIVPTRTIYRATDQGIATDYYHWFFLIQPFDFPERLIGADPDFYFMRTLGGWGSRRDVYAPEALAEYLRCFRDPAAIHAACEDYRAAATIDLVHDEADIDRRIAFPLLALWGKRGIMEKYFDVLATWNERAADVRGQALDCGHFLPEEAPAETAAALLSFFGE